jgi:lysosomal alpha-mannosidase
MGIVQHHDAISGTEKQEVAYDYAQRLSVGIDFAMVCQMKCSFFSGKKFQDVFLRV